MALLPEVFNANDHEKMGSFEPLPAKWYLAEITKSELKDTKAKTGKYLSLQFKILDEDHKNRYVFTNLNLINPNQTAVEIAQKELATICGVCGLEGIEDSTELHGIPMAIRLSIKPGDAQYPARNEIKEYREADDLPEDDTDPFEG